MEQFPSSTLLIVDDEPELVDVLANFAQMWGIRCITAASVNEAMDILSKNSITAILSDISMPGCSGIDFLKKIRATGSEVPLAFLTAHDTKEHMLKALQYGATYFIEKPFQSEDLKNILYVLLDIGKRIRSGAPDKKMLNLLRIQMGQNHKAK